MDGAIGADKDAVLKLRYAVLFLVFLATAVVAPLLDAQICHPATAFPVLLLELNSSYSREDG